jgi:FKBP-type peptidyl-prolyl cis-trans isomerase
MFIVKAVLPSIATGLTLLAVGGCGGGSDSSSGPAESTGGAAAAKAAALGISEPKVEVPKGAPPKRLVVKDLNEGSGKPVGAGDELTVEYVGIFFDGSKFTNSWERDKPFEFRLGDESAFVDPSWQEGLKGMRLGGRRELIVPPAARGAPPGTPASQTIVYVVDLVAVDYG